MIEEGWLLGSEDGWLLGWDDDDGCADGCELGSEEGWLLGWDDGCADGCELGSEEGWLLGWDDDDGCELRPTDMDIDDVDTYPYPAVNLASAFAFAFGNFALASLAAFDAKTETGERRSKAMVNFMMFVVDRVSYCVIIILLYVVGCRVSRIS